MSKYNLQRQGGPTKLHGNRITVEVEGSCVGPEATEYLEVITADNTWGRKHTWGKKYT